MATSRSPLTGTPGATWNNRKGALRAKWWRDEEWQQRPRVTLITPEPRPSDRQTSKQGDLWHAGQWFSRSMWADHIQTLGADPRFLLPAPTPVKVAGLLPSGPQPIALLPAGPCRRDKVPAQLLQSPSDTIFEIAMNTAPIYPGEIARLEQAVNEAVEAGRGGPLHDGYALRATADVYVLHHPHTSETLVVGIHMPGEARPTPVLRRGELRAYMLKVKDRYERRGPRPEHERRVSESPSVNAVVADVARRLSQRYRM